MAGFPGFRADQSRELKSLGLCDEQISALRSTLVTIRSYVREPAARNEVAGLLSEVEALASELSRKLSSLATLPDAAHPTAGLLLEELYWRERPEDDGPTAPAHLCPRLDALAMAARDAVASLPKGKPVRPKAGNPVPVRHIDEALFTGWVKAYGPIAGSWARYDNEAEEVAAMLEQTSPPGKPYPVELRPSVSVTSAFYKIVGICYAAAGYAHFPKRALEAFVAARNNQHREMLTGLEEVWQATTESRSPQRPRKSDVPG